MISTYLPVQMGPERTGVYLLLRETDGLPPFKKGILVDLMICQGTGKTKRS
jgi:hypothetical protein